MRIGLLLGGAVALAACKERAPEQRSAASSVAPVAVIPSEVPSTGPTPTPSASPPEAKVSPQAARLERLAQTVDAKPGCTDYGIVLSVAWPSQPSRTTWLAESLRAEPELLTWLGEGGGVKLSNSGQRSRGRIVRRFRALRARLRRPAGLRRSSRLLRTTAAQPQEAALVR